MADDPQGEVIEKTLFGLASVLSRDPAFTSFRLEPHEIANAVSAALRPSAGAGESDPPWERCTDARLRELWKAHGGGFRTKKGVGVEAFSEMHLLPALLEQIIKAACNAKETP